MTDRLTTDDWIAAGFRALSEHGPAALKAEPLAKRLGTTKGSFYWHFKDVAEFHRDMLALWEDRAAIEIMSTLDSLPNPEDRLRTLAQVAGAPAPARFGGRQVEPAIRAWALSNPEVAAVARRVDDIRIAYLEKLLEACDRPKAYGTVIYAAYIGLDELQAKGVTDAAPALSLLVETILSGERP